MKYAASTWGASVREVRGTRAKTREATALVLRGSLFFALFVCKGALVGALFSYSQEGAPTSQMPSALHAFSTRVSWQFASSGAQSVQPSPQALPSQGS